MVHNHDMSEPDKIVLTETEGGLPLELRYYNGHDDGMQEGWQLDLIEAYHGDEPVGYLKLAYIDREVAKSRAGDPYTHALYYKNDFYQTLRLPEDQMSWSREQILVAIAELAKRMYGQKYDDSLSKEELQKVYADLQSIYNQNHAQRWQEWTAWHVGKPRIDYINVYGPKITFSDNPDQIGETNRQYNGNRRKEEYPNGGIWRRQGIGTLLYQAGAEWMHEKGMMMYASTLQSSLAEAAWDKLGKMYKLGEDNSAQTARRYLDGSDIRIPRRKPELIPVHEISTKLSEDTSPGQSIGHSAR
jgi:hypothetical protein